LRHAIVPILALCLGGCRDLAGIEDLQLQKPFLMPARGDQITQLQVASGFVYTWSKTRLYRCAEAGCNSPETVVDAPVDGERGDELGGVFFDGATLVFTIVHSNKESTLFTADLAGKSRVPRCTSTVKLTFVARGDMSSYLALSTDESNNGELHSCDASATNAPTTKQYDVSKATNLFGPPGTALLYGAIPVDATMSVAAKLYRCTSVKCSEWLDDSSVDVDGDDIFVLDPDNKIYMLSYANGDLWVVDEQQMTFVTNIGEQAINVAVDRENAYTAMGKVLTAYPLASGPTRALADAGKGAFNDKVTLAVSAAYVYWIDQRTNAVFRVTKGGIAR
jgi:hypothetical protein